MLLGIAESVRVVGYTAVVGDSPYLVYRMLARRYKQNKFTDFKIKLSGNLAKDQHKLRLWKRRDHSHFRVRLDANNLWSDLKRSEAYLRSLSSVFWAVEEPLQPKEFQSLETLASTLGTKIILDESLTTIEDMQNLSGESWVCNLRVSKLGGLIRTMAIAESAAKQTIPVIIGSHVGETSLLTRAAIAIVQFVANAQLATEGAFGTHLLKEDMCTEAIQFDETGRVSLANLPCLSRSGSGLSVMTERLLPIEPSNPA